MLFNSNKIFFRKLKLSANHNCKGFEELCKKKFRKTKKENPLKPLSVLDSIHIPFKTFTDGRCRRIGIFAKIKKTA